MCGRASPENKVGRKMLPDPSPFFEEWFFEGGQTVPIFAKSISRNFPFEPIYAMKVANFE